MPGKGRYKLFCEVRPTEWDVGLGLHPYSGVRVHVSIGIRLPDFGLWWCGSSEIPIRSVDSPARPAARPLPAHLEPTYPCSARLHSTHSLLGSWGRIVSSVFHPSSIALDGLLLRPRLQPRRPRRLHLARASSSPGWGLTSAQLASSPISLRNVDHLLSMHQFR